MYSFIKLLLCPPILRPDFYRDRVHRKEHRAVADSVTQFVQRHLLDLQDRLIPLESRPIQLPEVLHNAPIQPSPQDFHRV